MALVPCMLHFLPYRILNLLSKVLKMKKVNRKLNNRQNGLAPFTMVKKFKTTGLSVLTSHICFKLLFDLIILDSMYLLGFFIDMMKINHDSNERGKYVMRRIPFVVSI